MVRLTLEVTLRGSHTQTVELAEPCTITLGRDRGCTIVLANAHISKHHAELNVKDGRITLTDLGSSYGTLVGGQRIRSAEMKLGAEFQIGPYTCRLVPDANAHAPAYPEPEILPNILHRLVSLLSSIVGLTDLRAVLDTLLEQCMQLASANRGYVVLARGGELASVVSQQVGTVVGDEVFSRTVCRQAMVQGREIFVDAAREGQLINSVKLSLSAMVAAIPLMHEGVVLGVVYMESDQFSPDALLQRAVWSVVSKLGGKALQTALKCQQLVNDSDRWRWLVAINDSDPELAQNCTSPAMQRVHQIIKRVASEDITALILGESGTGKEVAARTIHRWSSRKEGPFVAVNCGAIPRELIEGELFGHEKGAFTGAAVRRLGRLELAEGGTLLLDEIGDLPKDVQVKLLRVLETRTVERLGGDAPVPWNARVLAATNRDLEAAVAKGDFREDLYYRLNVVTIRMPSLRERREDVAPLAGALLRESNLKFKRKLYGITPEAMAALEHHPWPGNIRELRNVIERAYVMETGDRLSRESLPFDARPAGAESRPAVTELETVASLADFLRIQEREYITLVLEKYGGNVVRTAEALRIARSGLYRKLMELGIRGRGTDEPE